MNLYERNLFGYLVKNRNGIARYFGRIQYFLNKEIFHNVFLKYMEIPITTKCTLNCKECCNLIQYYQSPYEIEGKVLLRDIRNLTKAVKGIRAVRILGGEPLLHGELAYIIKNLLAIKKIKHIQIVTNGTLVFSTDTIDILKKTNRVSVDISNYEEQSKRMKDLIQQLEDNDIKYSTQKTRIYWTAQADCSDRNRTEEELQTVYSSCTMDCISFLNGRLHICPRSSHGMDLGIIEECKDDYVDFTDCNKSVLQSARELYVLLNKTSIRACNYCDVYKWKTLPEIRAAEQIAKLEAKKILGKYLNK